MEALSRNKIKWVHSLRMKKNRIAEGVFVIEGEKIVHEVITNYPDLIVLIATTDDSFSTENSFLLDDKEMKHLSQFKTPSPILAVIKIPEVRPNNNGLILALDGVQDPGNLGTIIRTADWFGIEHVICSRDTADAYTPKVVQASMGSIFRVPISYVDLIEHIPTLDRPVFGALLEGKNLYDQELDQQSVLVMGSEGQGISKDVRALIDHPILIPRKGGAESLNVSIATAVILAEFTK